MDELRLFYNAISTGIPMRIDNEYAHDTLVEAAQEVDCECECAISECIGSMIDARITARKATGMDSTIARIYMSL